MFGDKDKQHDSTVWEKMLKDWEDSFQQKLQEQKEKNLDAKKDFLEKKLKTSLNKIPEYLEEHQVDKEEFYQAWSMMNGLWNTIDFENIRKIVKLQKEYPELLKVANRMGRIADDEGSKQVYVTEGSVYKLAHSQKSDILGVTIGNDLNALLPSELLYYADSELQDVFMLKYFTQKLQTFRYKSEIMQPSRRLEAKPAVLKGPMIVCLDTSGSMTGKPERMANSLLIKLIEIAELQNRECFLITFSVSTKTIDIRRDRLKLMGDDPRVGLYLHRPDGSEEHFYPPSEVLINTGKRLCFTPGFAFTDGEWVAEVVTQYTPNSRPYKQPRYGTLTFLVR